MDLNWICEAYRQVRKNAATGIDGQTVAQYGENLVENLRDLQTRAKSGSYQAPPVKRAYVPKNEKEDRPIGIPTTEDKILQWCDMPMTLSWASSDWRMSIKSSG